MRRFVNALTTLFAGSLAVLFIVTTGLAFVLYNIEQSLFDAELYIQAFEKESLYQRLPGMIGGSISVAAQQAHFDDPISMLKDISESEWEIFISELLPTTQMEILVKDSIRGLMAFLNGEKSEVVISLISLKTHLQSPQGINTIIDILASQPECTPDQIAAIASGQGEVLLCSPPDVFMSEEMRPIFQAEIGKVLVSTVPEEVTILSSDEETAGTLQDLKGLRSLMRLSPIFPMMLLLILTLVTVRSLSDWLYWWGFPLWFAGLFSMALIFISGTLAAFVFQIYVVPVFPESFPPSILELFEGIVSTIAYDAVRPTIKISGIMGLIGVIMVAVAFLFRKKLS